MSRIVMSMMMANLLCASHALAEPVPTSDLRQLVVDADVIVIGTFTPPIGSGRLLGVSGPATTVTATATVEYILKGNETRSAVEVRFPSDKRAGYSAVLTAEYQVLFLKGSDGRYQFASSYYPSVPVVRGVRTDGADPFERVMNALCDVLLFNSPAESKTRVILESLWGVDHPAAIAALNAALDDAAVSVRLSAAAALLRVNQIGALPIAEAALLNPANVDPNLLQNLRGGIADGMQSETSIPALQRLMLFTDVLTRRAIVAAFERMNSPAAAKALVVALDDSDFEVRLRATQGLAKLSGNIKLLPSEAAFREDERRFAEPVRSWVAEQESWGNQ